MKSKLSEDQKNSIITEIDNILKQHPQLSFHKKMKLFCYYTSKGKLKKLIFYLNPRADEVIFGIGHWGTDILEKYPILQSLADETKTSVMKFSIKNNNDIEKKAISKIIAMIIENR